tara:strand:+ start:545 stop:967 length:423 start_codon:yes stop_codon:yes gene_type:complete
MNFKIVKDASGKHILPKESKRLLWVLLPKYIGLLILLILVVLSSLHCTSAPNGAINYSTTEFYQDGKFLDNPIQIHDNPMEFPIKDVRGYIHYYNQPVIMHHSENLILYCKRDKQWEKIQAFYNHKRSEYEYVISRLPKQ